MTASALHCVLEDDFFQFFPVEGRTPPHTHILVVQLGQQVMKYFIFLFSCALYKASTSLLLNSSSLCGHSPAYIGAHLLFWFFCMEKQLSTDALYSATFTNATILFFILRRKNKNSNKTESQNILVGELE